MKKQAGADRRGFLAMLGLGSVAGPGMVKSAVEGQGFNALGQAASFASDYNEGDDDDGETEYDETSISSRRRADNKKENQINRVKEAVKRFNDAKTEDYKQYLPNFIRNVRRLDSDLVANRSLSLNARIRLQAIRNLEEDQDRKIDREESYMHNAVKRARSYLTDNECFDLIALNIIRDKTKPLPTMEMFLKVLGPRDE